MARRKTKSRRVYRDHDLHGPVNVVYTPTTKRYSAYDRYSILRQRIKRAGLHTSPTYLLTPKPVKRVLARTNVPTVRTAIRNKFRGRNILGSKKNCKHAEQVRRRAYFRKTRGNGGSRPPHKRQHKC